MKKKARIPAEVLEQLEEQNPRMAREVRKRMDEKGRVEVRDEVWNRITGDENENGKTEPILPECIDTGLTIGDLLGKIGKK